MTKPTKWVCIQWRLRLAWASIQSDQNLRCPHDNCPCPGWSESLLDAHSFCWFWKFKYNFLQFSIKTKLWTLWPVTNNMFLWRNTENYPSTIIKSPAYLFRWDVMQTPLSQSIWSHIIQVIFLTHSKKERKKEKNERKNKRKKKKERK